MSIFELQPPLNQSDPENIFRNPHSPNLTSSSMIEQRSDEIDGTHKFNESQNENEEFFRVLDELEGKKRQYLNEQQRVTELEEQLHVISKYDVVVISLTRDGC